MWTRAIFLPALVVLTAAFSVTADDSTAVACEFVAGCAACLENPNGCVWALGQCLSLCGPQTEGATCYSTDTFPEETPGTICTLAQSDNSLCNSRSGSCAACTSAVKSDGTVCHWYEMAGACFGGGCGPFGCGVTQCGEQPTDTDGPVPSPTVAPVADVVTQAPTSAPVAEVATEAPTAPETDAPTAAATTSAPTAAPTIVASTAAPTETPVDCGTLTACEECVDAGCAYAVDSCLDSCSVIADTSCYALDQSSFTGMTAQEICQIRTNAVADQATCESASSDCETCTSAELTNPEDNCFWFAGTQSCSAMRCDQEGQCGVSTCDASPDAICEAAGADCATCLEASCAWVSAGGICLPSCDVIADAPCFAPDLYPGFDNAQICEAADADEQASELCSEQLECDTCVTTPKGDGTFCEWYMDEASGIQWCQTGGCDANGVCGMQECPEVITDDGNMTIPGANGGGLNGTNTTCDMLESCVDCITGGVCVWLGSSCAESCENTGSDAICTEAVMDMAVSETCDAAADAALCASKNYCFTCTATVKSDGETTCSWYRDGDEEWCDVGGCNEDGVCGDPDEASCQADTSPIGTAAPNGDAPAPAQTPSSADVRNIPILVSFIVGLLTLWTMH